MGLLASTPFIGAGVNNFSHYFQDRISTGLSRLDSSCPASVQTVYESDSDAVPLRSTDLSRFATERAARVGRRWATATIFCLAALDVLPHVFCAQKTAARGSAPAATGFDFYRILST